MQLPCRPLIINFLVYRVDIDIFIYLLLIIGLIFTYGSEVFTVKRLLRRFSFFLFTSRFFVDIWVEKSTRRGNDKNIFFCKFETHPEIARIILAEIYPIRTGTSSMRFRVTFNENQAQHYPYDFCT